MKYVNDLLMQKLKTVTFYTTSDTTIFDKNEIKKLSYLFDEGNKKFRKVIMKLYNEGINTLASCIGHSKDDKGYISFQLNNDNFYNALDIALGLAERENLTIETSTSFFKNPANMLFRFDVKDRDKIYDRILKWQVGKDVELSNLLSKQYYIIKMISQRTSLFHQAFYLNLKEESFNIQEDNHIKCSIKHYKDYESDCKNAIKIKEIITNSNDLTQIYNELKKIPPLSGEKIWWFDFESMNIFDLKNLLLIIKKSHADGKITGMEHPVIRNIYNKFYKQCLDLKLNIDINSFYSILVDIEEELQIRIAKINYQAKKGKSY